MEEEFWQKYKLLAFARVLLVLIPQSGYIHPDEYFQTIEVLASDTFELDAHRPWEYDIMFPIRSIAVPFFTVGVSYKILSTLDIFCQSWMGISIIGPYMLLVIPRLFVCLLSFICDYCMYHICIANNEKYKSRLLILNTSYVMLIYGSRTLSNTLEMVFFSTLLYFVSESMIFSNVIVKHHEYFQTRYDNSETVVDRAKFHKMVLLLAPHDYRHFFLISTIIVFGIFNRPTFVFYCLVPVFFWLYRCIGSKLVAPIQLHLRSITVCLSTVPTIILLILMDSFYYGYLTWGEIGMLDVSIDNFVVPCFNFIRYNWNEENLEKHGKHPLYLHLFVNVPLLFNILGIFALFGLGDFLTKLARRRYHQLPRIKSIKGLMVVSMIAPVLLLSAFSHQEPRFIIPIIFPMVYLYADKIYEEPEQSVVEVNEAPSEQPPPQNVGQKSRLPLKLWVIINLCLVIFYGFIHQGGVYPAYTYLSKEVNARPNTQYNIFTSHIYNMPYSMFLQPKKDKIFIDDGTRYQLLKRVFLYEEGSKDIKIVLNKISTVLKVLNSKRIRNKMLYVVPSSLEQELNELETDQMNITMGKIRTFYPHLSMEAFPNTTDFMRKIALLDQIPSSFDELLNTFYDLFKTFGLSIYIVNAAI